MTTLRIIARSLLVAIAGCAKAPYDPPQTHVGTCTHYQSPLREYENVPNCELRTRHTLINGLAPAYPGNKS